MEPAAPHCVPASDIVAPRLIANALDRTDTMSSLPSNEIATRESWKILALPETRADLDFAEAYTLEEFERIRRGLIPHEMEDKWFVFFEEPWLFFHRSWTGSGIYGVRFQLSDSGASAVESWVSRDRNQYTETRTDYDRAMLEFLIDALLLGKRAVFPVPGDVPASVPDGLYQHHSVGRAYPESTFPNSEPSTRSPWERITKWFTKR